MAREVKDNNKLGITAPGRQNIRPDQSMWSLRLKAKTRRLSHEHKESYVVEVASPERR